MKYFLIIPLLILLPAIGGCESSPESDFADQNGLPAFSLTMSRTDPAPDAEGSNVSVEYADSTLHYHRRDWAAVQDSVTLLRDTSVTLTPDDIETLRRFLVEHNLFKSTSVKVEGEERRHAVTELTMKMGEKEFRHRAEGSYPEVKMDETFLAINDLAALADQLTGGTPPVPAGPDQEAKE